MSALTDFLLARIADDEDMAREAVEDWYWTLGSLDGMAWSGAQHVIRFDPARMLAECKAKRRIVGLHLEWEGDANDYGQTAQVLRLLAQVYADHPDYDPAWGGL